MNLAEHVRNAVHQLKEGETIGRRGTPVISWWPMRAKWEKWGAAWETLGTDGDSESVEDGKLRIPAVLRLAYFRLDGQVCQLAYVVYPEVENYPGLIKKEETWRYDNARCTVPQPMEV
jgi:hypothetical protein